MKKNQVLLAFVALLLCGVYSCKKDNPGNGNGGGGGVTPTLTISLSKNSTSMPTPSSITFTVIDQTNAIVTDSCTVTVNGLLLNGSSYTPNAAGTYNFVATRNGVTSNTATLTVTPAQTQAIDSLFVSFGKDTVEFNGFDTTYFIVKDINNVDVTTSCKIFVNSIAINANTFTAGTANNATVFATKGTQFSKNKILYVKASSASLFTKKILLEDFTGTWCGYCTRLSKAIEDYSATHTNNFVPIGVHGYAGTSDPFVYQYESQLGSKFNVTGYPTAILNRKSKWDETTNSLNNELTKYTPVGLAISSTINSTSITGTVQVKYGVSTSKPMKIVIALVENGLVKDQTNYYSPTGGSSPYLYGGANPIVGMVHNNVMRRTSTNYLGDDIPANVQIKDNVYSLQFNIPLSGLTGAGVNYTAIGPNTRIVAYVLDGASVNNKGVYNAQSANAGTTKNFD